MIHNWIKCTLHYRIPISIKNKRRENTQDPVPRLDTKDSSNSYHLVQFAIELLI